VAVENNNSIQDLVSRWHQSHRQGQSLTAEELCSGSPDRLEELKRHLREVAQMQSFLQITNPGATEDSSSTLVSNVTLSDPAAFRGRDPAGPICTVGGYEVLGELGRGGMGVVYKARQKGLKRVVALKMVQAGRRASADQLARFRTEAEAVARLQHPNIVQIYEIGEHEGCPFFSMEYVDGVSLAQSLAHNLLPPRGSAALLVQLADAIDFAHQEGIIHRDLKPANILLGEGPRKDSSSGTGCESPSSGAGILTGSSSNRDTHPTVAKITDFGLAKQLREEAGLTQTGAVMGTPSYMAPEQADSRLEAIGPATDVYALGAVLYECLTGRPPFRCSTLVETLEQVRRADPVPPSRLQAKVPHDLEVICLKCLQKEPGRRYASAGELADDLRRFQEGVSIRARAVGWPERAWRWCRRNPTVAGLLTAVSVSLLAGMAGILHFAYRATVNAQYAQKYALVATNNALRTGQTADRLRQSLLSQYVGTGTHALEAGNRASGMWYFTRAWELDAGQSNNEESHRLRLGFTLQSGPQLTSVFFHRRPVRDAVFDPAGKTVLTRTDEPRAYLWDPLTSRLTAPPLTHDGEVRAGTFSPSGRQVATGSADGCVRIWDARTGVLIFTLPQGGAVNSLAYRTDGGLLAAASEAGLIHFCDPATGQPGAATLELKAAAYHVAFSPDGRQVVTADAGHEARVWDVASGKAVARPLPHRDHQAENEFAISYRCWPVFSPDGSAVVTVHPNRQQEAAAVIWDLASGEPRFPPLKHSYFIHQLRFSRNGSQLLVLCGDAGNLYDPATGKPLGSLLHPREAPHAAYRPDGKILASCSTGGLVHLWDVEKRQEIDQPLRCADGVQSLDFSPDGQHVLVASYDGTARVWSLSGSAKLRDYAYDCGHADRVLTRRGEDLVRFSPDGRREVCFGGPAGVRLRDRVGAGPDVPLAHPLPVLLARFSTDGRRLLTLDAKADLRWWNAADGRPAAPTVSLGGRLYSVGFSDDGGRLLTVEQGTAVGSVGRTVTVWDVDTGRPRFGPIRSWDTGPQRFGESALLGQISQAALSPDGTRLVLGADGTGMLGVWDVDNGRELARNLGYRGLLNQVTFSTDGHRFLTFGSDTVARLWQTATCAPAGPPLRHSRFCRRADLAPEGWRVVTVDAAQVIRLWDGHSGDILGLLDVPLEDNKTWFSRDGRQLILNAGTQTLDLPSYDGDPATLPALLRLLTGLQYDSDDSISPVDPQTFLRDPQPYYRAWLSWRGRADEPSLQMPIP
jgi:serine/threonine protein kinase/WD40 repeat protein